MAASPHTAHVSLPCGSSAQAELVRRAIQAEADEAPDGARCVLSVRGEALEAAIEAADVAGLRAALNTVVRLADAALRTMQAGRPGPPR
jgi:tRNA threonylcarbamoyladenosine modification (KEOPS) complex  Pcc1 subunit